MKRPRAPNHINRRFIGGRRRRVWNGVDNDGRLRQGDHFDLHLGQRALESGVHHIAGLKVFLTGRPVAHANHHPAIEKVMDTHLRGGRGVVTRHSETACRVIVMASSHSDSRLIQRLVSTKRLMSELAMISPTVCLLGTVMRSPSLPGRAVAAKDTDFRPRRWHRAW